MNTLQRTRGARMLTFSFVAGLVMLSLPACTLSPPGDGEHAMKGAVLIEKASAQEMYQMFMCPCCGQPIDTGCCGAAEERKAFVDGLIASGMGRDDAVMAYVQQYGLNSFRNEDEKTQFRELLIASAPEERPVITLEPASKNLGEVSQAAGIASASFVLRNEGKEDLVIDRLETSCGCTSAAVVFEGQEGPRFAMPGHGVNENVTGWSVAIPPGESAELKVYYDPDVHKDFRGAAMREIYVFSNDPIDFQKKVRVQLEQID